MAIYTMSTAELESLLARTIKYFSDRPNVYDFSGNAAKQTIEAIMAEMEAEQPQRDSRRENSLPDEEEPEFDYDAHWDLERGELS